MGRLTSPRMCTQSITSPSCQRRELRMVSLLLACLGGAFKRVHVKGIQILHRAAESESSKNALKSRNLYWGSIHQHGVITKAQAIVRSRVRLTSQCCISSCCWALPRV